MSQFMNTCRASRRAAIAAAAIGSGSALGVSFFAFDGKPTDLINQPNNYYSWPDQVITWKFTEEFLDDYPSPFIHEQVRLAFREWEISSISAIRRQSPRYGWERDNGNPGFYDMRTVMTHELGHVLGSQHPDACWYNTNPDTGLPYNRNYNPDGIGGWIAAAPIDGGIMNEGDWPSKGLSPGEYIRLTSKDELNMLDHAYGFELQFQEVFGNAPADILIDTFTGGGNQASTLGVGGPDGSDAKVPGDNTQGRWITSASIAISDNAGLPIGFSARPSTWEYTNGTGQPVSMLSIRTRGSDNPAAISWTSQGAHKFNTFTPSNSVSLFDFEDRSWRFQAPAGGSVPPGQTVKVGLRLDVWDWSVVSANVVTTGGIVYPACLVAVFDWINLAPPADNQSSNGADGGHDEEGDGLSGTAPRQALNRGFRIVNSEEPTTLTTIEYAPLDQVAGSLGTLDSALLRSLRASGAVRTVQIPQVHLKAGEEFVIVLSGGTATLPRDLIASGNFIVLSDPDVALDDYLVHVSNGCTDDSTISSFTILNEGPFDPPPCPGDLDNDLRVTLIDLSLLLAEYGMSGDELVADLNGDGVVDILDLSILLSNFGVDCN